MLEEGRTSPKAFLRRLPADLLAQIEAIVKEYEASKKPAVSVP